MSKEKEANKTVSKALLESYRDLLYQIKDYFDSVNLNDPTLDIDTRMKLVASSLTAGEKLGKNIETLAVLESKVEKEETEEAVRRGKNKTSKFEN